MTDTTTFPNEMRTIRDFQAFHRWLDEKHDFDTDLFLNMMLLSGEVGEVAQVLKQVHFMIEPRRNGQEVKTREEALAEHRENLGQELADCLAYIFKLANYTGVDLQEAYLKKMAKNIDRTWKYEKQEAQQVGD
ncbi:MAG TPA: MazG-like family protein [Ktedonobacteraceae bacterium]|nr:MazG-like family protein [Ktedonobacteraceae bacterium]